MVNQKASKLKGNIYHLSQIKFSYNSNKFEGSRLTEEETEAIFNTSFSISKNDDILKLDDLTESKKERLQRLSFYIVKNA